MQTLTNETQTKKYSTSTRVKLGLSFLAFILIGANDGAQGVLIPSFTQHYAVDKATIALVFLAGALGYLVASFNVGLLMQKLGNWQTLLLGIVFIITSTGVLSFQPWFPLLLISFFLLGMGVAVLDPGLNIYVAELPRNTALLNYLHGFYGIGAWIGPIIASTILALHLGWQSTYMVWCAVAVLLLISIGIVFRDWRAPQQEAEERRKENLLAQTFKLRFVWIAAFFLLFYVGGEVTMGNWSYSLLTEERHGAPLISGWIVSGYWLGLTLGRLLLGKVSQHLGDKRMIQLCLGGVFTGLLLTWIAPLPAISALGLFLTGFSLGPIFPTTIAIMSRITPSRIIASAIGFLVSLGSMGAALFPWIMGNLAQHLGLWTLLPFCMLIALVQLVLWLALQREKPATEDQNQSV